MSRRRHALDTVAFALALAALGAVALAFVAARNGAAVVMCGLCIAGLLGGRAAGVSGLVLLPVAVGLAAILWAVWIAPFAGPRETSVLAHGAGGALIGSAIAVTLRRHLSVAWVPAAVLVVASLALVWEMGELFGDRVLDTALIPSKRDSALDVLSGCLGGAIGVGLTYVLAGGPERRQRPIP